MINKRIENFVRSHLDLQYDEGMDYVSTADPTEVINYKAHYTEIPPVDVGRCCLFKQVNKKWQIYNPKTKKYIAATDTNVDRVEDYINNMIKPFFVNGQPNYDAMLQYKSFIAQLKTL